MNEAMNEALSSIPVKVMWAFLIVLAIVGSLAMGTFAPSMEGIIQIIFAIGLGLVLYFGPEAEKSIRARAWDNFGWYSLLLAGDLLFLICFSFQ
jgi:TRAP-type C4-dicarboxylate transport system permease large subunit